LADATNGSTISPGPSKVQLEDVKARDKKADSIYFF
jgi:hypothetical protein